MRHLFELIVGVYFLGWLLFLVPATWFPKKRKHKIVAAIIVTVAYHGPFAYFVYIGKKIDTERKKKYPPAKALFYKLCAEAQENIYKTAKNVEGILLLNIRKGDIEKDKYDPYWPDAALPTEYLNEDYILSFLDRSFSHDIWRGNGRTDGWYNKVKRKSLPSTLVGYAYVDVKEGEVFMRYKYGEEYENGEKLVTTRLEKEQSPLKLARYKVSFFNNTSPEYRKHWIASTTVTITDTWSHEIMAEKTWYTFQQAVGIKIDNKRSSWSQHGDTCPKLDSQTYITARFVNKVLQSNQEY